MIKAKLKTWTLVGAVAFGSTLYAVEPPANWDQFLGPTAQGISLANNLPTQWSESEGVKWKVDLPGSGWSSPVITDGRIYLTAALQNESSKTISLNLLICDLKTGDLQTQIPLVEFDSEQLPDIHQKNSHASPTPLIHQGRVYLHFGHMGTYCTNLKGELVWKRQDLKYQPVHGNGGSPILVGSLLIFNCDGGENPFVIALDANSGETAWKVSRPVQAEKSFSFSTPTLIQVAGQPQLITAGSDVVQSLEPQTGKEIWRVTYEGFSVVPRPIFTGGLVVLSTGYMRPQLMAIDPTGAGDVTSTHVKWSKPNVAPNTPSIVSDGELVYCVTDAGIARALELTSGEEVWRKRLGGNYSASPLLAAGKIYFQSEQGEAIVLDADRSGNEVSRNQLPGRIFASYAVADQDLIIRSETTLYRIGR